MSEIASPHGLPPAPDSRRRPLFHTWFGRIGLVLVIALLTGTGWWVNEHRTLRWSQMLNPVYWYHHFRGDDLYDASDALLLHGNYGLHEVALTFDDGPHRQSCGKILDTLKRYGVHATFFDVGLRMAQSPDLVRRTLADGNEIGNHTYNHRRLYTLTDRWVHREINDTDITYYRITGRHLFLLRPPGMRDDPHDLAMTKKLGYITVDYDEAAHDYDLRVSPGYIIRRTIDRVSDGAIILLHDYPEPAAALPTIIQDLKKQGYRFVTISQMIADLPRRQRTEAQAFLAEHSGGTQIAGRPLQPALHADPPAGN